MARRGGIGPLPYRLALAARTALAGIARLSKTSFHSQFQILTTMAKNHILPRYLLWVAVCVCVLLSSSFLGNIRETRNDGTQNDGTRIGQMDTDFSAVDTLYEAPVHGQMNGVSQHEPQNPRLSVKSASSVYNPLRETYRAEIGVKEATGNNDGNRVGEYLRYCGLDDGYAWCAAFVSWCHGQAGYPEPRNAWAAALFPAKRVIWRNSVPANPAATAGAGANPAPTTGDVFGIYYSNLKRIAHVGFVDRWDDRYCITVEGNTGPPADGTMTKGDPANPIRAGPPVDGVYRKRRPIKTIKAVARWTK